MARANLKTEGSTTEMCMYCERGKQLDDLMIHITELSSSNVYLVRNQNYPGRCVVAFKEHKTEAFHLTPDELNGFFQDVAKVAQAVYKMNGADKINYAMFGDTVPHFHCHIAPKKEGEFGWGQPFALSGNDTYLDDGSLLERASKIKALLQ